MSSSWHNIWCTEDKCSLWLEIQQSHWQGQGLKTTQTEPLSPVHQNQEDPAAKSLDRPSDLVNPLCWHRLLSSFISIRCPPSLSLNCFSTCDELWSCFPTNSESDLPLCFFLSLAVNFSARLFTQPSWPRERQGKKRRVEKEGIRGPLKKHLAGRILKKALLSDCPFFWTHAMQDRQVSRSAAATLKA